jgi:hypothetical protein
MPGFNAMTYLAEFRARALPGRAQLSASPALTDHEILNYINRALVRIGNEWPVSLIRERRLNAFAGTALYLLPPNRLSTNIANVSVRKSDGRTLSLRRITHDEMRDLFDLDDTSKDSGDPAYWTISRKMLEAGVVTDSLTAGAIPHLALEIRPVPRETVNNGIIVEYARMPSALSRVYNNSNVTINVTFNDNTAIIEAGNEPVHFLPGDEVGIVPTLNFDGSAATNQVPVVWYPTLDLYDLYGAEEVVDGAFDNGLADWAVSTADWFDNGDGKATLKRVGASVLNAILSQEISGITANSVYELRMKASVPGDVLLQVQFGFSDSDPNVGNKVALFNTAGSKYLKRIPPIALPDEKEIVVRGTFFNAATVQGRTLRFIGPGFVVTGAPELLITIDDVSLKKVGQKAVVFDRAYEDVTASGKRFIAAQVPDLEKLVPGGMGMAPVHLGLAEYFSRTSPAKAREHEDTAVRILSQMIPVNTEGRVVYKPGSFFPWMA